MNSTLLVQNMQAAVGPVILISGIGLLLLSMTNRYARIIDRARSLADALRKFPSEKDRFHSQLEVIWRRARLARAAITLATVSILLTAILVITLFLQAYLHVELAQVAAFVFILCMSSLVVALLFLLREINLSLAALKVEIGTLEGWPNP